MKSIFITGGAGFIGVNAAEYFSRQGWKVVLLDNLSRKGASTNLEWIRNIYPEIEFIHCDIRESSRVLEAIGKTKPNMLLHLAAQVAVTTSYQDPRHDFEVNALGTLNLLEAIRLSSPETFFLYASTNKVYGGMENDAVEKTDAGYKFVNLVNGVSENQPLDFHSPYGCSKGVADQYTIDYSRIYGIKSCSFRQSCIYGVRQFGIEDQGWVAWFTIAAMLQKKITIYGDGWQTRDVLNVSDLCRAYELAWIRRDDVNGQALNIGGGKENTLCLRNLLTFLEDELGTQIEPEYGETRPGDQPVFICDIHKSLNLLEWQPAIDVYTGVRGLAAWVKENRDLFL